MEIRVSPGNQPPPWDQITRGLTPSQKGLRTPTSSLQTGVGPAGPQFPHLWNGQLQGAVRVLGTAVSRSSWQGLKMAHEMLCLPQLEVPALAAKDKQEADENNSAGSWAVTAAWRRKRNYLSCRPLTPTTSCLERMLLGFSATDLRPPPGHVLPNVGRHCPLL